jgi:hypothetical protein
MKKLSLVGMQLLEKYKENFDVSNSSGVTPWSLAGLGKLCWHNFEHNRASGAQ